VPHDPEIQGWFAVRSIGDFSQKSVFRLEGYRLAQHGPSYPTLEVSFDRKSGQYKARSQEEKDSKEKVASLLVGRI
jgi:hypothetical protein